MSLDYPEYQQMKKDSHFASVLWQIGDKLYYLFLLLAIISCVHFSITFLTQNSGLKGAGLLFLISVLGVFVAIALKNYSYHVWKSKK